MGKSEIEKIQKLVKKKKLKKLLKYLATEQDEGVVEAVFEAIGSIKGPDAVAELCRFMRSEEVSIRRMAAKALTVAAGYEDIEKLRHFADVETDEEIKSMLTSAAVSLSETAQKEDIA